jgi:uncharacterized protein (TIGR02145 family)
MKKIIFPLILFSLSCDKDPIFGLERGWLLGISEIPGCMDNQACNYDENATISDGSCLYIDCTGECGGGAFENECGFCVGGSTGINADYCMAIDVDGNEYETIKIGNQIWMTENLKVTHYRNGDEIPTGYTDSVLIGYFWQSEWQLLSEGAYTTYNDDPSNVAIYGYLYNFYAATDSRKICPEDWHVPTQSEWSQLIGYLGYNPGSKLAGREDLWINGVLESNSEFGTSGFNALPGGYRPGINYYSLGYVARFWTSTNVNMYSWQVTIDYDNTGLNTDYYYNINGFSVRCIKD